ncbi:hypothetical protein BVV32_14645 [Staphylococcus aureus]|nr:hypothetical protein [Staphylococcus capitis]OLZ36289.1 hypothetical protein BVV32_14645 [Staphylococcus aureus]PAK60763.1 hypothetical protein B9K01_12035 [Staphylococcus capitis]PNN79549.1 hypothetical protein RK92_009550 [Staphylococcus aureus]
MRIKYSFFLCFNQIFTVINTYILFDIQKYFYVLFLLTLRIVLSHKSENIYYKTILHFQLNLVSLYSRVLIKKFFHSHLRF